jgi:hypothetical protein
LAHQGRHDGRQEERPEHALQDILITLHHDL